MRSSATATVTAMLPAVSVWLRSDDAAALHESWMTRAALMITPSRSRCGRRSNGMSHAMMHAIRSAFTRLTPKYTVNTRPLAINSAVPLVDWSTAPATLLPTTPPRPRRRATTSGDSCAASRMRPSTPVASSAVGSSHRNARNAIPPASRPPARRRSSSIASSAAPRTESESRRSCTRATSAEPRSRSFAQRSRACRTRGIRTRARSRRRARRVRPPTYVRARVVPVHRSTRRPS